MTGTPRLKIDMDPAEWGEKWAAYTSGSGTTTLTFAHTVVEPNYSSQGIAVLENTLELNGGTIRTSGEDADLAHTGLGHDPKHKVDWESGGGATGQSTAVAPTVTEVSVASSPASGSTYRLGETIRITRNVQRAGAGDRQPAALDRHGPGGVGHEAGGLLEAAAARAA